MKYVIQPGDTLSQIAERHGLPTIELARVNGITDPDKIYAGHIIEIPETFSILPGFDALHNWIKKITGAS